MKKTNPDRRCARFFARRPPRRCRHNQQLGEVRFETSCTPKAQKLFNQALLYQHSFWYRASQRTFEEAF